MKFTKLVTTPDEAELFVSKFNKLSEHSPRIEFILNSKTRIFYKDQEIWGGYLINSSSPYRSFTVLPSNICDDAIQFFEDNVCEVCCAWIEKDRKRHHKIFYILFLIFEVLAQNKRWVVMTTKNKLVRMSTRSFFPKTFYRGVVMIDNCRWDGECCYSRTIQLPFGFLKEWLRRRLYKTLPKKIKS